MKYTSEELAAMAEKSEAVSLETALQAGDPLAGKTIVVDQDKLDDSYYLDPDKLTVYLCGGFYGDWNDKVKEVLGDRCNIIDPRDWKSDKTNFVGRDLSAIDQSDIIFAYRQLTNPAYGMVFELGYAAANDKEIYFCGEYETRDIERYFKFCRDTATVVADNLAELAELAADSIDQYNSIREGLDLTNEANNITDELSSDIDAEGAIRV